MALPVAAAAALTAGLRNTFMDEYDAKYTGLKADLAPLMHMDVPSDKLTELYAYFESTPNPQRWVRGDPMPHKAFKSVAYSVTNADWAMTIDYHMNDVDDDQIKGLMPRVQEGAGRFALLDERVFYQIITNTTDSRLLGGPTGIPTAPDGSNVYSASTRFGASSGNLLTGGGVAAALTIRNDLMSAYSQFGLFQDTEGQPMHNDADIKAGLSVLFNVSNVRIFQEALAQNPTFQSQTSGGSIAAAAVQNVVTATAGIPVKLIPSQRITDNSFYVFMNGSPVKAIFSQNRQGLITVNRTLENSDQARETRVAGTMWFNRKGYGARLPYATIKVVN